MKKFLAFFLALLMLLSAAAVTVLAEDPEEVHYTSKTSNAAPTMSYLTGCVTPPDKDGNMATTGDKVTTAAQKIATMDLKMQKDGYRLYVDAYSGEVCVECIATGETLFTNPYDLGAIEETSGQKVTDNKKSEILSQIMITYTDITTGQNTDFFSYKEAATRGQIVVKNIKGGIRVEYTLGREEAKLLLPMQINRYSFEEKILAPMEQNMADAGIGTFYFEQFKAFYSLQDPSEETLQVLIDDIHKNYPITEKMPVYVIDAGISAVQKNKCEGYIKSYVPDYTYEELDEDHAYAEYESEDENPPLFKLALEYTLDKDGLKVRLPANGIRFNETLYRLYSLQILPFMGCGKNPNAGYTFFPDGSGALFDFEEIFALSRATTQTGRVYGTDFAYHTITGTHQEIIRYPVYGISETESFKTPVVDEGTGMPVLDEEGNPTYDTTYKKRGFVAIVEEGDAMMELTVSHPILTDPFNTVKLSVYPRPQDTYNLKDAISVGSNTEQTVVSDRKYTGSYTIRYFMLTDPAVAAAKGLTDTYEPTYFGMALAYRDRLIETGVLTKLTEEDVGEDIPLYIKTFGTMESVKKVLSIPVNYMAPLTSFEDIQTMSDELKAAGIGNINFILTGYTDGGLNYEKMPYYLKWEKSVGGKKGFSELLEYAEKNGVGIYPDFDFVYSHNNTLFDGLTLKKHCVKTIDDRYTSRRVYSATKQTYVSHFELAISPAYYSHFYEKFDKNYGEKFGATAIAVSTLGCNLNSDFDEDEPYNREDSKGYTEDAFAFLDEHYASVLTSGGNAFSWKYVDHITDIALDSSRFAQAAASVPFLGIVLHGYVQYAGSSINMEGNTEYAFLKAIENGAGMMFTLSYENTDLLKEDEILNQYYSVRYDIWKDDLVSLYLRLNETIKDLQTSAITGHEFLVGMRVPDDDELDIDARKAVADAIALEDAAAVAATENERRAILKAREQLLGLGNTAADVQATVAKIVETAATILNNKSGSLTASSVSFDSLVSEYEALLGGKTYDELLDTEKEAVDEKRREIGDKLSSIYLTVNDMYTQLYKVEDAAELITEYAALVAGSELNATIKSEVAAAVTNLQSTISAVSGKPAAAKTIADDAYTKAVGCGVEDIIAYAIPEKPEPEAEEDADVDSVAGNRYVSDENKIVHETFENGAEFILNFNSYAVTCAVGGVSYTVPAYGFIRLH